MSLIKELHTLHDIQKHAGLESARRTDEVITSGIFQSTIQHLIQTLDTGRPKLCIGEDAFTCLQHHRTEMVRIREIEPIILS